MGNSITSQGTNHQLQVPKYDNILLLSSTTWPNGLTPLAFFFTSLIIASASPSKRTLRKGRPQIKLTATSAAISSVYEESKWALNFLHKPTNNAPSAFRTTTPTPINRELAKVAHRNSLLPNLAMEPTNDAERW